MTKAAIGVLTFDKEGFPSAEETVNITFQAELSQITDTELGRLLSLGATSEELELTVDPYQMQLDYDTEPKKDSGSTGFAMAIGDKEDDGLDEDGLPF